MVRHRIGYVPQHAGIDPTVPASALDVVLMGRLHGASWGPRFAAADVEAVLARTGTAELARRPIAAMSGGQLHPSRPAFDLCFLLRGSESWGRSNVCG